jgi:hypothetical protein
MSVISCRSARDDECARFAADINAAPRATSCPFSDKQSAMSALKHARRHANFGGK